MKKLKIGLDVHGVIDMMPSFFSHYTKMMREQGHEIHVITGQMDSVNLRNDLEEMNIEYDHLFSISTDLIQEGELVRFDGNGNPWFDDELWDKAKGKYCSQNDIDYHYDDTERYGEHFITPFIIVY